MLGCLNTFMTVLYVVELFSGLKCSALCMSVTEIKHCELCKSIGQIKIEAENDLEL